jgi:hypothetical protein
LEKSPITSRAVLSSKETAGKRGLGDSRKSNSQDTSLAGSH